VTPARKLIKKVFLLTLTSNQGRQTLKRWPYPMEFLATC